MRTKVETGELILIGSGGHAKVVLEAIQACCSETKLTIIDDDPRSSERRLLGHQVQIGREIVHSISEAIPVIVAIGENRSRMAVVQWLQKLGRKLPSIVHPTATVSPSANLGEACFIAAGAVINAESTLGIGTIVNTCASVDHDCRLGDGVHVAPGARLCGGVTVGARSLFGAGAVAIPGVTIGCDTLVAAGSVVIRDVLDGRRVAGCPATNI